TSAPWAPPAPPPVAGRAASERIQWLPTMCRQQTRGQSCQTSRPPLRKRKGVTLAYSSNKRPKKLDRPLPCESFRRSGGHGPPTSADRAAPRFHVQTRGLHENRHHLVSKEHSLTGQA